MLVAPSGYGKTVLAGQIAGLSRFSGAKWIECGGHPITEDALLARVADVLERKVEVVQSGPNSLEGTPDAADSLAVICNVIHGFERPWCVVLDDIPLEHVVGGIAALGRVFRSAVAAHALVVTTRDVPLRGVAQLGDFSTLEMEDLRFSVNEAEHLVRCIAGNAEPGAIVSAALELSDGQAALLSVLARHAVMRGSDLGGVAHSLDLTGLLITLAGSQLSRTEMESLHAIALLGHSTRVELCFVSDEYGALDMGRLSRHIPLLRLVHLQDNRNVSCHMHALAQEVYGSRSFADEYVSIRATEIRNRCMQILEAREDYPRLVPLLIEHSTETLLATWLLENGSRVASAGHGPAISQVLDSLQPSVLLTYPKLLLMSAEYGSASSDLDERLARAAAAADLAAVAGDEQTRVDALMVKATACKDLGKLQEARDTLEQLTSIPSTAGTRHAVLLNTAYLLTLSAGYLDESCVAKQRATLLEALSEGGLPDPLEARLLTQLAVAHLVFGEFVEASRLFARASKIPRMPVTLRAMVLGNLAMTLLEMGRVARVGSTFEEVSHVCIGASMDTYRASGAFAQSATEYLLRSEKVAFERFSEQIGVFGSVREQFTEANARLYRAGMLRGVGRIDSSMSDVEAVIEYASCDGTLFHQMLAEVELAANFLALGDLEAASRHALRVREVCAPKSALYHLIRADLVLAEIARRQGRLHEGVSRLLEHEAHILQENANYTIAIYTRAFPAMLGMVTAAIGANRVPAYLLQMLKRQHAEDVLFASRDILEESEWEVLAARLLGGDGGELAEMYSNTPPCRVRLFGGLEVHVGGRNVPETDWKKRKSRLLFAVLVLQQGRDVSRESIYEHLWPEMDEERARNNLYVTWSAIKAALMPGAARDVPCSYISHKGGVCHISTALVRSDVAEFDELLGEAHACEATGDSKGAVRAYESLVDVYQGELLPGDVYDDWFSSARERYRQDFGDAMLRAYELLTEAGDHSAGLRMARRGIAVDAWREDLYQAALRSQIAQGQRGAAVDTYLTCRTRLAEDLGLDPSVETVRLYEQVLAMEDGPTSAQLD